MAIWLKTSNYRLNLNNIVSTHKTIIGGNVTVDIKDSSGDITSIAMIDSPAADELINIIVDTINSGGDVNIDAAPFEKI